MKNIKFLILLLSLSFIVPTATSYGQWNEMLIASQQQAGGGQDPGDVFPTNNAAGWDDVNTITGWATQGSGAVASVAETSGGSDYVIEITSTDATASQGGNILVTGLNGSINYDVSIRYRVTVDLGSTQAIRAWSGVVTSPEFTMNDDGAWHTEARKRLALLYGPMSLRSPMAIFSYLTQAA